MKERNVFLVRNVAEDKFGGGEKYQIDLAEKLKQSGFWPVILTNSKELLGRAKKLGIETLRPPYIKNQNWSGWRNLLLPKYFVEQRKMRKWYERMYVKYEPCVVNLQSRDDLIAGTLAAKKYNIRVIWTDHADFKNWVLWNVNVPLKNVIGRKIIKLSNRVEKVIFVSKNVRLETQRMIAPKRLDHAVVIENGVEDKLELYNSVKLQAGGFVYVGRVNEEKGVGELLDASRLVVAKYPGVVLNIYGDGDLEKYKKLCGGCDGVFFHGATDEPLKVMAENEIFVLPSYQEGLSLSLLEAAMMGKKIIATDVDGNSEVVENGKTGLLVPAKNVEKLAEAMIYMLENKKKAEMMAKGVRLKYEKEYDIDKIFAEKMLPLYNEIKEKK